LFRAAAILRCLVVPATYEEEIDPTEVAHVALRLVGKAVDRLDIVTLNRAADASTGGRRKRSRKASGDSKRNSK
jgi:hypothetical protein